MSDDIPNTNTSTNTSSPELAKLLNAKAAERIGDDYLAFTLSLDIAEKGITSPEYHPPVAVDPVQRRLEFLKFRVARGDCTEFPGVPQFSAIDSLYPTVPLNKPKGPNVVPVLTPNT